MNQVKISHNDYRWEYNKKYHNSLILHSDMLKMIRPFDALKYHVNRALYGAGTYSELSESLRKRRQQALETRRLPCNR